MNEPLIYIEPTLAIHIEHMLNTNVDLSMKFGTVGQRLDSTIEPIVWQTSVLDRSILALFSSSIVQVNFNVESTLYDGISM